MTGIVVDAVSRAFGSVRAVQGASFEAKAGNVTGLVGPNGSGKTTLLLMLASLLAPDGGTISINGINPIADPRASRKIVGWMPDSLGAWPSLTVRETLQTTGRLFDLSAARAAERTAELLDLVGLRDLEKTPARVLSRGQKQKLGLARALVHEPQVLLLDEPASGLDPQARVQLRTLLRELAASGCTVLISSHVLTELEEVIDDAVFLVAGRVVDAPPAVGRVWRLRLADTPLVVGVPEADTIAQTLGVPLQLDRGAALLGFATETDAASALAALISAGLRVAEFTPAQSSLETAFLNLGSAVREGAQS